MRTPLPDTITRADLLQAFAELDAGAEHPFADSIGYDVLHEDRRYPPKAVVGLAATRCTGRTYRPADFTGGLASKCFRILETNGFRIVGKGDIERARRDQMWKTIGTPNGGRDLYPRHLQEVGVFRGARGVWYDGGRTKATDPEGVGVTVGLLHTGKVHPDEFTPTGIRYHYPVTNSPGRDAAEIHATKAAGTLKLPVFVVTTGQHAHLRDVYRGWVRGWDDGDKVFWIDFSGEPASAPGGDHPDEVEPDTYTEGAVKTVRVNRYERDEKARQTCIDHYGARCGVCKLDFKQRYGEVGDGFIHVHHLVPLAAVGGAYEVDPILDLRPVCPNCHAMLHRRTPEPYTIEELRAMLIPER
ncbi:MAG TPA: HNH endonuclease [Longimicrobiaceae bacterium]|nr:HNH endonuclease [Longimicrobiaceae bacterium]